MTEESYEDRKAEWERIPSDGELTAMLAKASRPGFYLDKVGANDPNAAPGCWLGGRPTLPSDIPWPKVWLHDDPFDPEYPEGPDPYPMHFIGQINLAAVPQNVLPAGLPDQGTLFFFADAHQIPLGFARPVPVDSAYTGTSAVIYVPEDINDVAPRDMPEFSVDMDALPDSAGEYLAIPNHAFAQVQVAFRPFVGLVKGRFENSTFFDAVNAHSIKAHKRELAMFDARMKANATGGARAFSQHHFCGANARDEVGGDLYRLLAVQDDRDIGLKSNAGWIVFWIGADDLKKGNFAAAFTAAENL